MAQRSSIRVRIVIALLLVAAVVVILVARFGTHRIQLPLHNEQISSHPNTPEETMPDDSASPNDEEASTEDSGVIEGHVVKPNGEPMAGALVRVLSPGDQEPHLMKTNESGRFQYRDLSMGLYAVEASHTGFGPAYVIGVVPGGAPLRLVLRTGKTLRGNLLHDDKAVAGGTVHLGGPGMFPQRSQPAGNNGHFQVGGLRAGTYEAIAVAPGYSSGFVDDIPIDSDEKASSALQFDMRTAPVVTLHLRGKRDQKPVATGVITISPRPVHVLALSTLIHDGQATIDFLPRGEYWIRIRAPGYMPHEGRFWVRKKGGDIDLRLSQGATIKGRVVDAAHNPISGARLRAVVTTDSGGQYDLNNGIFEAFQRLARPDGTPFWWPTSNYRTDKKGRFEIQGIPAGTATIVVQHAGYGPGTSQPLKVQRDDSYQGIRITLEKGVAIRGRVEGPHGNGLAGASISVAPRELPAWIAGVSMVTDRSGAFHFTDLPRRVRVMVRHPDYGTDTREMDLGHDGKDNVVIKMHSPNYRSYRGRVLTTQKGPATGAHVWLMNGGSEIPTCTAVTDEDGKFHATHCTAKPERIIIWYTGYAPLRAELTTPSKPKDWVLRAGGQLDLVSQRHPADVTLTPDFFIPRDAMVHTDFQLDRWERIHVKKLTPGRYTMTCEYGDAYAAGHTQANVEAGERTSAVCPPPQRIASRDVIVVDKKGAPVAKATVWFDEPHRTHRATTDKKGRVHIEGDPGTWIHVTAVHEAWGQGSTTFQLSSDPEEALRLDLEHPVGGADQPQFLSTLNAWGIQVATDGNARIIQSVRPQTPAAHIGFQRGDHILWARPKGTSRLSVGVQRHHHVVVFQLVQGEP